MPETAIVTIRYEKKEADYSLPLNVPIHQWLDDLLGELGAPYNAGLAAGGKILDREKTLASCQIWDGAELTVERR